ncbi:HDL543Wp [Eremothecium sinecaudum]|uniref:HDL543Wp n=1 Tax=Eremothecium sinecaudum TaxID=45286 RepID=A0A0X8HQN7_9SACH|nr:HDL543Wp [Eremothecium sinecaudum]AMD20201.1 HDL543Wp [Eremothecium sinecaudum]
MKRVYELHKISGFLIVVGMILGIDVSSMAVFIGSKHFNEYFNYPTPFQQGMVSGAYPIGGLIGCVLFAFMGDRISRLGCFRCSALIWLAGCAISVLVINIYMIAMGRFVKGVAVGSLSVVSSIYLVEVFPTNRKGIATVLVQLTITFAIFLMYMACWTFNRFFNSHYAFRISWGLEIIPALALITGTFIIPESPKWFVANEQYNEAQEVLSRLNAASMSAFDREAILNMYGNTSKTKFVDLIKPPYFKQVLIGITIQTLVQFTGVNVLMYYLVYICEMAGLHGNSKMNAASMPYLLNILFTFVPFHFLDKTSRKMLIINGSFSLALVMSLIGFSMWVYGYDVSPINGNPALVWKLTPKGGEITIALCFVFVAIFASTLSCSAWLYTNEILPTVIKTKGLSVCMGVSWLVNFTLTFLSPLMMSTLKWGTFLLFGIVTFVLTIVVWLTFPETLALYQENALDLCSCKTEVGSSNKGSSIPDFDYNDAFSEIPTVYKLKARANLDQFSLDDHDTIAGKYRSSAPSPVYLQQNPVAAKIATHNYNESSLKPESVRIPEQPNKAEKPSGSAKSVDPEKHCDPMMSLQSDKIMMLTLTTISSNLSDVLVEEAVTNDGYRYNNGDVIDLYASRPSAGGVV